MNGLLARLNHSRHGQAAVIPAHPYFWCASLVGLCACGPASQPGHDGSAADSFSADAGGLLDTSSLDSGSIDAGPVDYCVGIDEILPPIVCDAPSRVVGEPEVDEIGFIYDQSEFRTFELRIDPANLEILDREPSAEVYVPATFVFEGLEYANVAVRYKGSYGSWQYCVADWSEETPDEIGGRKTCPKLSMKVSFNEYDPAGRFFGVKKLLFHSMNADESLMRERLGYALFRQMGVPAPRATHMRLLINGEFAGVFLNVEYVDGRFTRSRFADGKGNLYKEVWPSTSANQEPFDEDSLLSGLRTNEGPGATAARLLAFGNAVAVTDDEDSAAAIGNWMSIQNTMRYIAVDRTIASDDGLFHFYCEGDSCGNHNYYWYEETLADRVWLIPWDLDNAFVVDGPLANSGDWYVEVREEWDDSSLSCMPHDSDPPGAGLQLPPACDRLIYGLGARYGGHFNAALDELLSGPFGDAAVDAQLTAWELQIDEAVTAAHEANEAQIWPPDWRAGIADLRLRIAYLRDQARSRL